MIGLGSGKLGSTVNSIVYGTQVQREYRATISNPSTKDQVDQRARFKLASQVAAALSPVIAIPRKGFETPRNRFVKNNFNYFYAEGDTASVSYENLQLTAGNAGLPGISISRSAATGVSLALAESAKKAVTRVCYSVFKKTTEDKLQLVASVVVSEANERGTFPTNIPYVSGDLIVYAYGMKDADAKATAKYGNYKVATGEDLASLIMTRKIKEKDYTLTETRGTTIFTNQDDVNQPDDGMLRVYVTGAWGGTATAPGVENGYVDVPYGATLTCTASPAPGNRFIGWYNNGEQTPFSSTNPLTITVTQARDIVARFDTEGIE